MVHKTTFMRHKIQGYLQYIIRYLQCHLYLKYLKVPNLYLIKVPKLYLLKDRQVHNQYIKCFEVLRYPQQIKVPIRYLQWPNGTKVVPITSQHLNTTTLILPHILMGYHHHSHLPIGTHLPQPQVYAAKLPHLPILRSKIRSKVNQSKMRNRKSPSSTVNVKRILELMLWILGV